jgi:hypothetical protein
MPDMPISCVEQMRKTGIACEGYQLRLGLVTQGNAARSAAHLAPKTYIKVNGRTFPKHECDTSGTCVDCTFMTYDACFDAAKKAGVQDKRQIDLLGHGTSARTSRSASPPQAAGGRDGRCT